MTAKKNINGSKSFPWKAIFGAILIIGAVALLSFPNNSNSSKGEPSSGKGQGSLSGFNLKN